MKPHVYSNCAAHKSFDTNAADFLHWVWILCFLNAVSYQNSGDKFKTFLLCLRLIQAPATWMYLTTVDTS